MARRRMWLVWMVGAFTIVAIVVPHLVPVREAVDVGPTAPAGLCVGPTAPAGVCVGPTERCFVIENYQTSSTTWRAVEVGSEMSVVHIAELVGAHPYSELSASFGRAEADGYAHNRYIVVGTFEHDGGVDGIRFRVREWQIARPIDRGISLGSLISPSTHLTLADVRWFGNLWASTNRPGP